MIDYYNMADVFLLPSYEELFPMSVLEAFATGTPVMVRDLELYHQIITPYAITAVDVDDSSLDCEHLRMIMIFWQLMQLRVDKLLKFTMKADLKKSGTDFYLHQAALGKH